ncbi:hypothetical protein [Sulfurisphaera ohwakuensis]|uniref:Uncharacterized protein n=1 Tax=Sulfurisphaera ohwakuensis TaxID=69656 RepID=A0A650CI82_SULOH|nr:hypothetical protein [Sulfurisphaera ohwakuensis]MBB5253539.1 hypothetical protein [Sulfurisphaera ohwakuensis]QGR17438.1 hypothetical protein D1869_09700 [Sulfurisphaera ohwakuensis]
MRRATILLSIISVVLITIGVYFFMIDKPTMIHPPKVVFNTSIIKANYGGPPILVNPPPWYANLWPETLTAGIVLLLISALLLRCNS